jgi:hypothetical protein
MILFLIFRYGLPVNFQAILVHPNKKSIKRLRDVLNQLYGHLDGSASSGVSSADVSTNFLAFLNYYLHRNESIGFGHGKSNFF